MGDCGNAILLNIVRRQPMVVRANEVVEERPGAARQRAQKERLLDGQSRLARSQRTADPPGNERRGEPQEEDRPGHRQHRRPRCRQVDRRRGGDGRGEPHSLKTSGERAGIALARLTVRLPRRAPFEQSCACHQHPPGRAGNGVETEERLVRETGDFENDLQDMPVSRARDAGEVLPQVHLLGLAEDVEDGRAQRGDEHDPDHRHGPQPRRRKERPS